VEPFSKPRIPYVTGIRKHGRVYFEELSYRTIVGPSEQAMQQLHATCGGSPKQSAFRIHKVELTYRRNTVQVTSNLGVLDLN